MFRFLIILLICLPVWALAQAPYFQQEVHYRISATLNDTAHVLNAQLSLHYINNSPDTLQEIWFHLWPNAYRDQTTAFAAQAIREGKSRFYFAKDNLLGNISGLDFRINDKAIQWMLDNQNPDIAVLRLDVPLLPKQGIEIETPFVVKIPASFSRLGHVGQSYQMTQWYPKPAVYDRGGWHAMPYLDMGEFYSEFGSFEVELSVPENYIVMATGSLETTTELDFLEQKAAETSAWLKASSEETLQKLRDTFPASTPQYKTIRYRAEKVHDFAWFADKRFHVQSDQISLPSGKTVKTWTAFTNAEAHLWKDAINYVNRSLAFYSEAVGEYPWPQATAVQSALSAGGGMEYPMITVIGLSGTARSLDEVITHEVGHNWFYGILASNERDHAWMDEGLNSYYENRYMARHYEPETFRGLVPEFLIKGSKMGLGELAYLYQARRGLNQAPDTPSESFPGINYLLGAYELPASALAFLESYMGRLAFDSMMQAYYIAWQFKHPQPADLRQHFEKFTGAPLNWLFDGWLYSNQKTDYTITSLKETQEGYQIRIANKGDIAAPFRLSGMQGDTALVGQWFEGFEGAKELLFPKGNYDFITLDAARTMPDWNRRNNHIRTTGLLKTVEPFRFRFLTGLEDDRHTDLNWLPAVAWNHYDKWMAGLMLHNIGVPTKPFEFLLAPMYATGSKSLTGFANARKLFFPKGKRPQHLELRVDARRYHFDENARNDYRLAYARIVPALSYNWRKSHTEDRRRTLMWRSIFLDTESAIFAGDTYAGKQHHQSWIHELSFATERRHPIVPTASNIALEYQQYEDAFGRAQRYLKASLTWAGAYTYAPRKRLMMRVFGGGFIENTKREAGGIFPGAFNLVSRGPNDYRFDDLYFARSEDKGLFSQQISLNEGGFKTIIENSFSLGRSNNFIFALNLKADLPKDLPLKLQLRPYFDIGYFDNAMPTGSGATFSDQLLWSGGFSLDFLRNTVSLYFPIINSQNIRERFAERGGYFSRISFHIRFKNFNPDALIESLEP